MNKNSVYSIIKDLMTSSSSASVPELLEIIDKHSNIRSYADDETQLSQEELEDLIVSLAAILSQLNDHEIALAFVNKFRELALSSILKLFIENEVKDFDNETEIKLGDIDEDISSQEPKILPRFLAVFFEKILPALALKFDTLVTDGLITEDENKKRIVSCSLYPLIIWGLRRDIQKSMSSAMIASFRAYCDSPFLYEPLMVKLVQLPKFNPNFQDENGYTPLHHAAKGSLTNLLSQIVKVKGIDTNITNSNITNVLHNKRAYTAFDYIVMYCNAEINMYSQAKKEELTDILLNFVHLDGFDPNLVNRFGSDHFTSFHLCMNLHYERVAHEIMKLKGFNPNLKINEGQSIFWFLLRALDKNRLKNRFPKLYLLRKELGRGEASNEKITTLETNFNLYLDFVATISEMMCELTRHPDFVPEKTSYLGVALQIQENVRLMTDSIKAIGIVAITIDKNKLNKVEEAVLSLLDVMSKHQISIDEQFLNHPMVQMWNSLQDFKKTAYTFFLSVDFTEKNQTLPLFPNEMRLAVLLLTLNYERIESETDKSLLYQKANQFFSRRSETSVSQEDDEKASSTLSSPRY